MNLRKNLGRVASTIVATALLASVATVPAFALENPDNDKGQYTGGTFKIAKHLELAENTFAPNQTYTFNIAVGTATDDEKAKGIEDGVAGAVPTTASATITANGTVDDNNVVSALTSELAVKIGEGGITHAGSYKYTVTEADTADEGATVYDEVTYDQNVLVLYVHVKNDKSAESGLSVDFVELVDPDAVEGSQKIDGFTNEYGTKTPDDKLYNVTLKKIISGNGANMQAKFGFTIKVDSEYDNSKWYVVDSDKDGDYKDEAEANWTELKDGIQSAEIQLGHEEQIIIVGLTNGDSYTINESDPGTGYTTTATNNNGKITFTDGTLQFTASSLTADDTITYTNEKVEITPTGIVMNVAPYALLVVVAVAGCFVFLRKRNED